MDLSDLFESTHLTFRDESRGFHHGQSDLTIRAFFDGKEAGKLDYVEYQGDIKINFISVDPAYRRKGIGKALVHRLQTLHPGVEIDVGMVTQDGAALLSKLPTEEIVDHEVKDIAERLQAVRDKLASYQALADEFYAEPRSDDEKRAFMARIQDWNDLHDEEHDLEQQIGDRKPSKRLFIPS